MGSDFNINGLSNEYLDKLAKKSAEIIGDRESISLKDLKKLSIFKDATEGLSKEQLKKLDENIKYVAEIDSDKKINKDELKMILAYMDVEFDAESNTYEFDGKYKVSDKSEIMNLKQEKMSRDEAKAWIKEYMQENNCSEKEAKAKFKETQGYEFPKNFWEKAGDICLGIGTLLVVLFGTGLMHENPNIRKEELNREE